MGHTVWATVKRVLTFGEPLICRYVPWICVFIAAIHLVCKSRIYRKATIQNRVIDGPINLILHGFHTELGLYL